MRKLLGVWATLCRVWHDFLEPNLIDSSQRKRKKPGNALQWRMSLTFLAGFHGTEKAFGVSSVEFGSSIPLLRSFSVGIFRHDHP